MTSEQRFERQLAAILEDLYPGRAPNYRDEVIATAVRTRQRPRWTFPGRWLPMADIASQTAFGPRLPWRTVAVALLIIALLVATAIALVGSRQTKVPPPFGLAGNGRIAYVSDGDVFVLDPTSGATTRVTDGPDADGAPAWSPDGTRMAFPRSSPLTGSPAEDIVVANVDGSDPMIITPTPIQGGANAVAWAPDSRSLLVGTRLAGEVRLYDATRAAAPQIIARDAYFGFAPFQPPNGSAVMLARAYQWYLLDLATGAETKLVPAFPDGGFPRWSPDGSKVVYTATVPANRAAPLLFVANADGTDAHRITTEPATWAEFDPAWSPDGTRIAFNRAEIVGGQPFAVRQTGIVTVATGTLVGVGPLARDVRSANPGSGDTLSGEDEAYSLDWSPDGRWLLELGQDASGHLVLIDTASGNSRVLDAVTEPGSVSQAWQRIAP